MMKNFLVLRFFVLARRLVKIQAERLELERLRYERDYPPVRIPLSAGLKPELSKPPTVEEWNRRWKERQEEKIHGKEA
jgi:hypothetical protein